MRSTFLSATFLALFSVITFPPVAYAACDDVFVPPKRELRTCMYWSPTSAKIPEEEARCKREADEAYAKLVEFHRKEWERQRLECQVQENARLNAERERERQATERANEAARRAALERERQRAELEQAQLKAATEKARAEAAEAERKRRAAESPMGLSILSPNSGTAVGGSLFFVSLITFAAVKIGKLIAGEGRSVWRNVLIDAIALTGSNLILFGAGILTEATLFSIPIAGGLAIALTMHSVSHA